jgi:prepilin signal peptidase PulO-like enzyme (type II secretory pathway)
MKKILAKYDIVIIFIVVLALNYILNVRGIQSQPLAFMYLSGIFIFFNTARISLKNLLFNDKNSETSEIMLMIGAYWSILFILLFIRKLLNVEIEIAFGLIVFGIVILVLGTLIEVIQKRIKRNIINNKNN